MGTSVALIRYEMADKSVELFTFTGPETAPPQNHMHGSSELLSIS
jgi:hypothetical protein